MFSQTNEVNAVQEDGSAKLDLEIKVAVEGNLLPKGPKKGARSISRSISFLAILSDGTFIAYKRIRWVAFSNDKNQNLTERHLSVHKSSPLRTAY